MLRSVLSLMVLAALATAEPVTDYRFDSGRVEPGPTPLFQPESYDTLRWHDYSVSQYCHGGPTSGDAWLFGLGAIYTPRQYPAILVGLSHRVYRDPRGPTGGPMQIRVCDDDGPGGTPGTIIYSADVQADTWGWDFQYYRMPYPYEDTVNDGSFYLFYLSRDTGRVSYTLLWPYDLALNHLRKHWWHQHGQYNVCTSITADLSIGAVVEYPDVGVAEPGERPSRFDLSAPRPNPSTGRAGIRYALASAADVRLEVRDAAGRLVRTLVSGRDGPGQRSAEWDGRDEAGIPAANGVYICRLNVPGFSVCRVLTLSR